MLFSAGNLIIYFHFFLEINARSSSAEKKLSDLNIVLMNLSFTPIHKICFERAPWIAELPLQKVK
jgi:hypothetical protein